MNGWMDEKHSHVHRGKRKWYIAAVGSLFRRCSRMFTQVERRYLLSHQEIDQANLVRIGLG